MKMEDYVEFWDDELELKPCPFCGEAENIEYGIYAGIDYVQCQNCGAEVRALHNCEWIAAEELWNRRAY